ncbi:MAG: hypothetical protein KY393_08815 [Actinobacteria bacterium]|nr:hypothetical protein [Actinomycetota bacterium]
MVTNTGVETVTIATVTDDTHAVGAECTALVGTTLATAQSASCSFTGTFTGTDGETETNTATATAESADGRVATASDSETVTIAADDDEPEITVQKTASPTSRPAPGGDFTFDVEVTNTGDEAVAIATVTDDTHAVGADCTALVGTTLNPTESADCSFTGTFTGTDGDTETNTAEVTAVTAEQITVSDTDAATVTITGADDDDGPEVEVRKAAKPTSRPEPGGKFAFAIQVINRGDEDVELISLVDSVYGNLNNRGTCDDIVGTELEPGESSACLFEVTFTGEAGDEEINTVRAVVEEADGDRDSDTATAKIRITEKSVPVDPGGDSGGDTTIIVNNSSSSSSSSSAAAGGGGAAPSPTPTLVVEKLVRTGQDSLPMGAGAFSLLILGSLLVATGERQRRRRTS